MTIPVVQGVAVDSPQPYQSYGHQQTQHQQQQAPLYPQATAPQEEYGTGASNFLDGKIYTPQELQEVRQSPKKQFQDVFWAVLFWMHLAGIIGFCVMNLATGNGAQAQGGLQLGDILFVSGVCGLVALGLSTVSLQLMQSMPEAMVQYALIFSCLLNLVMAFFAFVAGNIVVAGFGLLAFAISCCYAYAVWHRIPYAAVNLKIALTGVKANMGLTFVAFIFMALGFGWSILWFMGLGNSLDGSSLVVVFFLFLSYYWTHEVLKNTMHVTSAGVIGTWWFAPAEANRFWAPALSDSLFRAVTYSFGSICLGSLLVAIIRSLRALEHYTRENEDFAIVRCVIQCILSCIESIIEYMNRWAYVYVGLYGFNYIEAGRNVITLFQNKGWSSIIADDLASNVLLMISIGIGVATGLVGMLIGWSDPNLFSALGFQNGSGPGFLVGFLVGFLFASVYLGVVDSAITTVIVCYAEAPAEFQMNHPELAAELAEAWAKAWPGLMG
mmetsp:Transcript_16067/g.21009  ORF Transcript_16067/g.21009 Transcript_16067/m.21009 type:complete len:497 (+) Transcript_16067:155-1645(+)|eukprot:CAMPEP_0198145700 /NCGR_PEP_ID=MMETSP1443-20131203/24851_1 /TAXON_ID=186043 /ORGANISM="Entomoneis sp., Strain CCMP2396" /LENGTH=496 /DNA_ID=CAMNT_0043809401 /DNA_START=129 /DNA_END=1619 /DNA_ORIENTATION=+